MAGCSHASRRLQPGRPGARPGDDPVLGHAAATPNSCAPRHGPFVVGSGVRFLRVFANADNPGQDILLRLYRDAALVATSLNVGFTPGRFSTSRPAERRGQLLRRGLRLRDASSSRGPTARSRSTTRRPRIRTLRGGRCSRPTRRSPLAGDPWGNPSTDTRDLWCWDAGEAGRLRQGRRQPRLACPVGSQRSDERSDVDHDREQRGHRNVLEPIRSSPSPPGYRPTSPSRDYLYRGRTTGSSGPRAYAGSPGPRGTTRQR